MKEIARYSTGFMFAILYAIILLMLQPFLPELLTDYMVGWLSCTGCYLGMNIYNKYHK